MAKMTFFQSYFLLIFFSFILIASRLFFGTKKKFLLFSCHKLNVIYCVLMMPDAMKELLNYYINEASMKLQSFWVVVAGCHLKIRKQPVMLFFLLLKK